MTNTIKEYNVQLQIDIKSQKSNIVLELLSVLKKDNMIDDYRIIDDDISEQDILNDLSMFGNALQNAKNGKGIDTHKSITIKDL